MTEVPMPDPELLLELVRMRMPFGKYQGKHLLDLPQAYLVWFGQKGFPPGKLGALMQLALEIDHNGLRPLLEPLRRDLRESR
jgi:uncharacterized protein (DUF3820 family)